MRMRSENAPQDEPPRENHARRPQNGEPVRLDIDAARIETACAVRFRQLAHGKRIVFDKPTVDVE